MIDWKTRIVADPAVLVGKPVIKGTRIWQMAGATKTCWPPPHHWRQPTSQRFSPLPHPCSKTKTSSPLPTQQHKHPARPRPTGAATAHARQPRPAQAPAARPEPATQQHGCKPLWHWPAGSRAGLASIRFQDRHIANASINATLSSPTGTSIR